jgi:hypothetical protein
MLMHVAYGTDASKTKWVWVNEATGQLTLSSERCPPIGYREPTEEEAETKIDPKDLPTI